MKLTNQMTIVIVSAMLGGIGMIVGLAVLADWSDGAIIGMVSGIGSVLVSLIVAVRGQQKTAEVLQDQNVTLDRVIEQTNGLSDRERQDIAQRAATSVLKAAITEMRESGSWPN